jgi:hypothetical protein
MFSESPAHLKGYNRIGNSDRFAYPFHVGASRSHGVGLHTHVALRRGRVLFKYAAADFKEKMPVLSGMAQFVNLDPNPTCEIFHHGTDFYLITLEDLCAGAELTVDIKLK